AAGWQTVTLKYGRRLRQLYAQPGGEALQRRIDAMSNEEFQRLLRATPGELRERWPGTGAGSAEVARLLGQPDDGELPESIRDLGGHDLADLADAFRRSDEAKDRPTVVFAYTIKGWRLPTEGHPGNHSALLSAEQWRQLAAVLEADADDPW